MLRREHPRGGHFGDLATEQGEQHGPPSNDRINSDGAGQSLRRAMLMSFNAATAFQHSMPILDAPAPSIVAPAAPRLAARADADGGQQHPAQGLGTLGRVGFGDQEGVKRQGR